MREIYYPVAGQVIFIIYQLLLVDFFKGFQLCGRIDCQVQRKPPVHFSFQQQQQQILPPPPVTTPLGEQQQTVMYSIHDTDSPVNVAHSAVLRCTKGEDRTSHLSTEEDICFFLLADGHGGVKVAELASVHLLPAIAEQSRASKLEEEHSLESCMHKCFLRLHEKVQNLKHAKPHFMRSVGSPLRKLQARGSEYGSAGTTCTVVAVDRWAIGP